MVLDCIDFRSLHPYFVSDQTALVGDLASHSSSQEQSDLGPNCWPLFFVNNVSKYMQHTTLAEVIFRGFKH